MAVKYFLLKTKAQKKAQSLPLGAAWLIGAFFAMIKSWITPKDYNPKRPN